MPRLLPFLCIGGGAFLLTVVAYRALTGLGSPPLVAQPAALWLSMTATWIANRRFTFAVAAAPSLAEYGRYVLASWFGAGVNYALFTLMLLAGLYDLLALAVATVAATCFNFLAYARFAFGARTRTRPTAAE